MLFVRARVPRKATYGERGVALRPENQHHPAIHNQSKKPVPHTQHLTCHLTTCFHGIQRGLMAVAALCAASRGQPYR